MPLISSLGSSTIHVWQLNLELEDSHNLRLKNYLVAEEIERAQRYTHLKAQQQFIAARGQLKQILASYLKKTPKSIQFEIGQYGKPRLAGTYPDQGLVFNLSHSACAGLVAISLDSALGVDIERINSKHNLAGMAQRCFSEDEYHRWEQSEETVKTAQFYDYWCAKEAFLKASGRGLALGLERCVIELTQIRFISLPEPYQADQWQLWRMDVDNGYRAYVARNKIPGVVINQGRWNPEYL